GPRADALEPPLAAAGVPPPTSTAPPYTTLFRAKPEGTPGAGPEREGATPRYTNDTNGAFESVATDDPEHGRVLRQQIGTGMAGSAWNGGDPKTTIGDYRWANYTASVDVLFEPGSGRYASIGAREQGGTANGQN